MSSKQFQLLKSVDELLVPKRVIKAGRNKAVGQVSSMKNANNSPFESRLGNANISFAKLTVVAAHAESPCKTHFVDEKMPVVTTSNRAKQTTYVCFEEYAVLYSGVSRTPLWSAEHLTRTRIEDTKGLKRQNAFHAEEQLPASDRSELMDYAHSGYDRGHMSPSGDMSTANAQYESFSLANMIPQNSNNNQILWEGVEEATRHLAKDDGDIYVVTGPIFEGTSLQRVNGRVFVPTSIFKAIYDPVKHAAAAYIVLNAEGMQYKTISVADLEKLTHIDVFPGLSQSIKESKLQLPVPTPHGFKKSRNGGPVEVTTLSR
jgi:endonuclease G